MSARHRLVLILVSMVVAIAAVGATRLSAQRAMRDRTVVVSVLDKNNTPVSGLKVTDFVVREDDVAREVLRVEQADAPMQIVALVDTSAATQLLVQDVRKGVQGFARAIWAKNPDTEIALMEF